MGNFIIDNNVYEEQIFISRALMLFEIKKNNSKYLYNRT